MKSGEPRYVCHDCIGDKVLKKQVEEEGTRAACSYCHTARAALTLTDLSDRINQVLKEHFKPIPKDDHQEHWKEPLDDVETVIEKVADLKQGIAADVRDDLFNRFAKRVSVENGEENPYSARTLYEVSEIDLSDFLRAWRDFRGEIHSRARFFGATTEVKLKKIFANLTSLKTVGGKPVIREIRPGDNDSVIWRARIAYSRDELKKVLESPGKEIGPPPSDKATAGRMNAEGIPVFYGALEEQTCVAEIRAPVGSFVVIGKFDLLNPIRILDLEALSGVFSNISHFDPNYTNQRSREGFLGELVGEISLPVIPHEEAREYLATQIVSEYLANRVDPRLHGMIFSSPQTGRDGRNFVLFNSACNIEAYEPRPGTGLLVVLPRQRGIPPPGTGLKGHLILRTQFVEATGENNGLPEDSTAKDLGEQTNLGNPTLRLDIASLKVINITSVKPKYDPCPLTTVNYISGTATFPAMTGRVDVSVRNQG